MKYRKDIEEYRAYLFRKELSAGTEAIYIRQARLLLDFLEGELLQKKK